MRRRDEALGPVRRSKPSSGLWWLAWVLAGMRLESADDPELESFIQTYHQGPQTPEPGAACTGGTGATL